jgi:DNA repair photolyase
MIVKEVRCRSCMTPSKLTDYVINPYVGCQHGCKYCYAVFMKRFANISEPWGSFVHAKVNCPELLPAEMERNRPGTILLSSVTDCYQPLEGRFRLTRRVLEAIAASPHSKKFNVEILTKSALVRRDFDLIKRLDAELGMSVNTLDGGAAKVIEPFASPPSERIGSLKEAKENGIRVYGFISPVIPGITDLDAIFREFSFCDYVWVELLNTTPAAMGRLIPVLKKDFPDAARLTEWAAAHEEEHFRKVQLEVRTLEKKYGLRVQEIVRHGA